MNPFSQLLALTVTVIAAPTLAFASSALPGADLDEDTLQSLVTAGGIDVRADYSYSFDSDFNDRDMGSLSVSKSSAAVRVPISLSDNLRLQTGVSYRRLDFDASSELVPEQIQGLAALVGLEYLIGGQPVAGIRAAPGFYFIDGINSDSFDVPTIIYTGFRLGDSVIGIAGASYSSLRPDNEIVPLAGFIWTISDSVKFNAILPVASLDFTLSDTVKFSVIGEYVGLRASTGDDLAADGYDNTSVSYKEMRAGAQLNLAISETASVNLSGGWAFRQEFEFGDPDESYRTGGAPFVGISLRKSF